MRRDGSEEGRIHVVNMPARKIPTNRRSLTGMVASRKNDRLVASESSLERDFLVLLEFDPAVERYEEQPVRIEYVDAGGRRRTYTPDVLVHYRTDLFPARPPLLCEVKYRDELAAHWQEFKSKVRAGRAYARGRGWRFKLVTERMVRTPYLQSAKFLRPYRALAVNDADVRLLLDSLREIGEADPERLLALIHHDPYKRAELLPTLWHLVSHGQVSVDLNQPLTMRSPLWTPTSVEGGNTV